MLTYTTVGLIIGALVIYGVLLVAVFKLALSNTGVMWCDNHNERLIREEKMRVDDRMREGRY